MFFMDYYLCLKNLIVKDKDADVIKLSFVE